MIGADRRERPRFTAESLEWEVGPQAAAVAAPSVAGYRGGEFALTETGDRTLVDVLLDRAARTPDRVGYSFLRHNESAGPDDLTYGELAGRSAGIAAGLAGVSAPGDRILLPSVHGPEFVTAFLGC